jgi:hypothetical protein
VKTERRNLQKPAESKRLELVEQQFAGCDDFKHLYTQNESNRLENCGWSNHILNWQQSQ